MPRVRRSRLVGEHSTNHCTWRSHNYTRVFDEPGARATFLGLVARYKARYGILLHSYCLMGTHPHVVCTSTRDQPAWSAFWKVVNQCFARWYNRRCRRRGQVVMERLRSPRIQAGGRGRHILVVMRYGDLNPVRARLVERPGDWEWSSYRHYALGEENALVDDAAEYLALGRTAPLRRKAYRALFAAPLSRALGARRSDLVLSFFIGDEAWVARRYFASGLSPPPAPA